MSDRYRFEESPQEQDFQGGAPLSPEGVRAADHYLLAQLGARVLEILRARGINLPSYAAESRAGNSRWSLEGRALLEVFDAARSLGLLEEKGGAS